MPHSVPVSFVMTRNVHTLDLSSKLSAVRHALVAAGFHHMPIVDGEKVVGMVSWRDLVRAYRAVRGDETSDPIAVDEVLDERSSIADVMTRKLVTVRDDDPLERAIDAIADGTLHSVLVLDEGEKLVGIVTDKNLIEYMAG